MANVVQAAECMGLPTTQSENVRDIDKRFSDGILKIELSHPEHRHLNVVDVPGLFHSTSHADIA